MFTLISLPPPLSRRKKKARKRPPVSPLGLTKEKERGAGGDTGDCIIRFPPFPSNVPNPLPYSRMFTSLHMLSPFRSWAAGTDAWREKADGFAGWLLVAVLAVLAAVRLSFSSDPDSIRFRCVGTVDFIRFWIVNRFVWVVWLLVDPIRFAMHTSFPNSLDSQDFELSFSSGPGFLKPWWSVRSVLWMNRIKIHLLPCHRKPTASFLPYFLLPFPLPLLVPKKECEN